MTPSVESAASGKRRQLSESLLHLPYGEGGGGVWQRCERRRDATVNTQTSRCGPTKPASENASYLLHLHPRHGVGCFLRCYQRTAEGTMHLLPKYFLSTYYMRGSTAYILSESANGSV